MDHETRKPSKLTPGKSKQDGGHRESATSSCSKQLVRKAKLSLQKSHKRGRRNLISTLTAADLNDTDDFKSARTLTDGCKTNRQTAERQNNVKRGQTCVDTHKTDKKNDLRSGQTSVDTHKTDKKNDLRSGQTFSNRQRMPLGSDGDSRDVAKVVGESTSVSTVCPACEEILNKEEFTDHIKTCLQQFAHKHERDGCVNSSPNVQSKLSRRHDEKSKELIVCQICQEDITNLNSERRTRHLNKCIDQTEAAKWEAEAERKMLENAKMAVLDCPLCGKSLKTDAVRRAHLKKCAHHLGIPLHQMMQSVKLQDEHHQLQLAAGVVPDTIRNRLTRKKSASNKKRNGKRIKRNMDEDLQLAMVLSSSMTDQQTADNVHITGSSHVAVRDGKKRKNKDFTELPLLLTLSKEEADTRVANKVTELLIPQEEDEGITLTPPMESSRLTNLAAVSVLTSFMENNRDMIWDKTGLSNAVNGPVNITSLYYTCALMPPVEVSTVPAGSKLSSLSQIPGWLISNDTACQQPVTDQQEQVSEHHESAVTFEDLVVSTQTALVLAELAADNSFTARRTSTEHLSQASGFCPVEIQIETHSDVKNSLSSSLVHLVNCCDFSDVTIVTKHNGQVFAHKVFLSARSPKLLQMIGADNTIDMLDVSSEAVICMLKYVYSGTVTLNREVFSQVLNLAQRLELHEYHQICKDCEVQLGHVEAEGGEQNKLDHDGVNPVWSSSDSEPFNGGASKTEDAISGEEWQEIHASQRKRLSSLASRTTNEMSVTYEEEKAKTHDHCSEDEAHLETSSTSSSMPLNEHKTSFSTITQPSGNLDIERIKTSGCELKNKSVIQPSGKLDIERNKTSGCELKNKPVIQTSESSEDLFSDEEAEVSPVPSKDSSEKQTEMATRKIETAYCDIYSESSSTIHGGDTKEDKLSSDVSENLYIVSSGERYEEVISDKQLEHMMTEIQYSSNSSSSPNRQSSSVGTNRFQVDSVLTQIASDDSFTDHVDESVSHFERSANKMLEKDRDTLNESEKELKCLGKKRSKDGVTRLSEESRKRKSSSSDIQVPGNGSYIGGKTCDAELNSFSKEPDSKRYKMSTPVSVGRTQPLGVAMDEVSKIEYCSPATEPARQKASQGDQLESNSKSRVIADGSLFVSTAVKKYLRSTFMLATPDADIQDCDVSVIKQHKDIGERSYMEENYEKGACISPARNKTNEEQSVSSSTMIAERGQEQPLIERSIGQPVHGQTEEKVIESGVSISSDSDVEIVGDNFQMLSSQKRDLSPKFSRRTIRNRLTQSQTPSEQDVTLSAAQQVNADQELSKSFESSRNSPSSEWNKANRSVEQNSQAGVETPEKQASYAMRNDDVAADSIANEDVWEGFDGFDACPVDLFADFGADADVESSPEKKVRSQRKKRYSSGSKAVSTTPSRPMPSCEQTSNFAESDDDILMIEEDCIVNDPNIDTLEKDSKFKTPQAKQPGRQKHWIPPSPFTPMQDYDKMVTPQLKKAVERYGLKPMCKKRMKLILKDIYQQTHQYETDSDYEPGTVTEEAGQSTKVNPSTVVNKDVKTKTSSKAEKKLDSQITEIKKPQRKTKTNLLKKKADLQLSSQSRDPSRPILQKTGDEQSEEWCASSSQESTNSDMPEESFVIEEEDLSASQQTEKPELHAQLMKFVMDNPDIHTKILTYEPLELDWLKLKLTEGGIKCSIQKLMDFLDEKCITFTMKKMNKRNSRRKPARRKKASVLKLAI